MVRQSKRKPDSSYWKTIEPIWKKVSIWDGPEEFLKQYSRISAKQRVLYAVHWCQFEVRNGGFDQFFFNSTGVLAPEAASGFKAMGMDKCAVVVSRAMRIFGSSYPRDRTVRNVILKRHEYSQFKELDKEFFGFIDTEKGGFIHAADRYAET